MGSRLVQQPNGLFAIFGTTVDSFTWYDLTQCDAFKALLYDGYSIDQAWSAVHKLPSKPQEERDEQWKDCLDTIKAVHGKKALNEVVARLEKDTTWKLEYYPTYAEISKGGE